MHYNISSESIRLMTEYDLVTAVSDTQLNDNDSKISVTAQKIALLQWQISIILLILWVTI